MAVCAVVAEVVAAVVGATGAAVQAHGEQVAANQETANRNFMAAQANADANAAQGAATVEAQRIRRAGQQQQGAAIAAAAASGVDINSESSVKIDSTITHNAEQDAYLTMVGGADQAARLRQGGQVDTMVGQSAQTAAGYQEAGTLLGAAGRVAQIGSNWKSAPGSPAANTPAPPPPTGYPYGGY